MINVLLGFIMVSVITYFIKLVKEISKFKNLTDLFGFILACSIWWVIGFIVNHFWLGEFLNGK